MMMDHKGVAWVYFGNGDGTFDDQDIVSFDIFNGGIGLGSGFAKNQYVIEDHIVDLVASYHVQHGHQALLN